MKTLLRFSLVFVLAMCIQTARAVLPNGSPAVDFTVTDLNGQDWNLFDLLDEGYVVYLEFSATWCGPCWNYHNGNHLKNLWDQKGPNGTDEVFVIFIEADPSTNTACLYGPTGCVGGTQGNWVNGTNFPITDLTWANASIASNYQITYYPTIYSICPVSRKVYEAGQRSTDGHYEYVSSCAMTTYLLNSITDVSCNGENDGGVDISPVNGTAPYQYTWSNNQGTQDLTNVPAGTYSCEIKEKNGISVETADFVIDQPDAINVNNDGITKETCPGYGDGSIDISADGGSGGFSYLWSNGDTSEDITDLSAGTYSVVVTDASGCFEERDYVVNVNPLPVANAGVDGAVTCKDPQFTIDGTLSENFGAHYQWTTVNGHIVSGANTLTPVVDQPGDYVLLVTFFATGCFSSDETNVDEDKVKPFTDAGEDKMLDCVLTQDTLNGINSQQGNGFTFLWTTQDGNILSGASTPTPIVDEAGTYELAVSNIGNGCVGRDTALVTINPNFMHPTGDYSFVATNLLVEFTSIVSGNPSTYAWSFGDGNTSSAQNPTNNYVNEGEYEVCLIVTNACGSDTTCSNVVVQAGSISVSVSAVTLSTCNHGSNGGIEITVSGGAPGYTYSWSSGQNTQNLAEIPPGTYSVTVTDSNNEVTVLKDIVVGYQFLVNIDEAIISAIPCFGGSNGAIALNTSSSGGSLNFVWSHDSLLNNSVANNLIAGSYSVVTTDPNGCTDAMTINLTQPDLLQAALTVINAQPGKNNGSASAIPAGGTAPYTFSWSNGGQGETIQNLSPGEYQVTLTDVNNCSWVEEFRVDEISGVQTITSLTSWSVSPNPATTSVLVELRFAQTENIQIRIMNILGNEVYFKQASGQVFKEWLPLGQLPSGNYLLDIRTNDGRMVQRMIIQ